MSRPRARGGPGPPAASRTAALAAAAAALTVLAYPPTGLWPLGLVMLAPLVAALEARGPRAAFAITWAYSVAMALVIVRWLLHALAVEYGVSRLAAWAFTVLLVAAYATLPAAAAALYAALRGRASAAGAPLLFAALFVAAEWLRSEPLGLPWILAGHVVARVPLLLQTADLGGVHAVGFLVASVGAGLGLALARRDPRALLGPALALALALPYGAWRLSQGPGPAPPLRVGVVQASVPQRERFQPGSGLRHTRLYVERTRALLARERLDLLIWSETAVDDDLDASPPLRQALRAFVDEAGVPLVTGAPRSPDRRPINAVVLFAPGRGLVETYAKQRLVPFAEMDPVWGEPLAALLGPVTQGPAYAAGTEPTVFRAGPLPFAAPICFEITYPGLVRRFRAAGAALLVNLSNDAWFGRSGYGEMHFLHTIFRAVELRTWVVRGANTGISGVIDATGRVVAELPLFEPGTLSAEVWPARDATLYGNLGDGPVLALLTAVAVAAIRPRVRPRRRRPGS